MLQQIEKTLANLDAVIAEAGRPEPVYAECIGPGCDRPVFTWLDPACNPGCARRAAGRQHPAPRVQIHNGVEWRELPVTRVEIHCGAIGWWGHTRYQCELPAGHTSEWHESDRDNGLGMVWMGDHTPPCACCPEVLPDGTRNTAATAPTRVDAYDIDVMREQVARVHGVDVELLGDFPPRPPEPSAVRRPLVDPRGIVQAHTPWWRRWLR